ncbi:MAG: hypothetical protein Q4B21_01075 [Bacteroidia bacterium]|nr:hypothetical protein [Bacteroidia bacterium]
MDAVIAYVDGNDPIWKKDYEKNTNIPIMDKRFRDWGTLKYLLRGIEVFMPFVKNVYLVVSHPSQVPQWANTENLKIVLHKDIIPDEYLPTFNCNTIETHFQNIPELDEQYLYFNDDMFPIDKCSPTDFFRNGKAVIGSYKHYIKIGMYKEICKNSDSLARKALGMKSSFMFLRPQHTCTPMLKSQVIEVYNKTKDELLNSLSITREGKNVNQYLFFDYIYYKGLVINEKISNKHFSVALCTPEKLRKFITKPTHKIVCINDVKLSEEKYNSLRSVILESFEERFPQKCRFEK